MVREKEWVRGDIKYYIYSQSRESTICKGGKK